MGIKEYFGKNLKVTKAIMAEEFKQFGKSIVDNFRANPGKVVVSSLILGGGFLAPAVDQGIEYINELFNKNLNIPAMVQTLSADEVENRNLELKIGFNALESGIACNNGATDPSLRTRLYSTIGIGIDDLQLIYEGVNECEGTRDSHFGKHIFALGQKEGINVVGMVKTFGKDTIDKKVGLRYAHDSGKIDLTCGNNEIELQVKQVVPIMDNTYLILFNDAKVKDGEWNNFLEPTIEYSPKDKNYGLFCRAEINGVQNPETNIVAGVILYLP